MDISVAMWPCLSKANKLSKTLKQRNFENRASQTKRHIRLRFFANQCTCNLESLSSTEFLLRTHQILNPNFKNQRKEHGSIKLFFIFYINVLPFEMVMGTILYIIMLFLPLFYSFIFFLKSQNKIFEKRIVIQSHKLKRVWKSLYFQYIYFFC